MDLKRWIGWQGAVSAALAVVVIASLWLSLQPVLDRQRQDIRYLEGEIAKLDPQVVELEPLKDTIMEVLARKAIIEQLHKDRYAVALLEELARRRPARVTLDGLREDRRRFVVTGFAASPAEAGAFAGNLKASPLFSDAQLVEVQAGVGNGGYPLRFTIRVTLPRQK